MRFAKSFRALRTDSVSEICLFQTAIKFVICVCFEMQKQICAKVEKAPVAVAGAAVAVEKRAAVPKAGQKKVTVKPKPEEVIEISPDTEEKVNAEKHVKAPVNKNKDADVSSKISYSSVLTARSKVTFNILPRIILSG